MACAMIEVCPIFSAEYSHGHLFTFSCVLCSVHIDSKEPETCGGPDLSTPLLCDSTPHRSSTICGGLDKVLSSIANYDEKSPCCPPLPPSRLVIDRSPLAAVP